MDPTAEIERLHARLRRLADEKSNLQLVIRLIEQLNPLPGIEDMVRSMLNNIVETIGGTDIKLYYWIEGELRYAAFLGESRVLPAIDDPLAARVAATLEFVEERGDAADALLRDGALPGSWSWGFPLLVGKDLIGVIKLDNLHLSGASLRNYLPIFFSHAALILSNEIRNYSRQKAEAALEESERLFRAITDTSPLAIYMSSGIEQRAGYINPTFTKLFGYRLDEVPSIAEWWPLAYPDATYRQQVAEEWQRKVERAVETRSAIEPMDVVVTCKDGSKKDITWGFVSVGQQNWAFGLDFTERKQAEEFLRRSEAAQRKLNRSLRLLSDCNTALVHAEDEHSLLTEVCRLCVESGGYLMAWVGYAEQDEASTVRPIAQSGYEDGYLDKIAVTWSDTGQGQGPTGSAIRTGRPSVNPDIQNNPGMDPWREAALQRGYRSSVALPLLGNADVLGALSIYASETDAFDTEEIRLLEELAGDLAFGITVLRVRIERQRADEEVRSLNHELERRVAERTAQLEAANEELKAFSYSISHDLRAPLRALDGYAHILREDEAANLSPAGKDMLERIWTNSRRMGVLIDDVLQFSRVGFANMNWKVIDMAALARSVAEEMRGDYPTARIRIDDLPEAMGDEAMLRQVWANLIGNALKFSAKRERLEIEIGSETQSGETVFYIRDNGAGFDMAYAGKLFGVFQRMHTEAEFPGTGAGLSIVKRIVERHGGRIWAEAKVDAGATFRFTLAG